jgi:hypothetical protein
VKLVLIGTLLVLLTATSKSLQADVRTLVHKKCSDPAAEAGRFQVRGLELIDDKTGLIWFRCPAMFVTNENKCDPSNTLPSEDWISAMNAPGHQEYAGNWRLPTVDELQTVIARGCTYQFRSEYITLPPVPLWTSSTTRDDQVWQIDEQGELIKAPKQGKFGWTIYVRDQ